MKSVLSCNVSFFSFPQRKLFVYSCNYSPLPLTFASGDIHKYFYNQLVDFFFVSVSLRKKTSATKKNKKKKEKREKKDVGRTDTNKSLVKRPRDNTSGVTLKQYHAYCGFTILLFNANSILLFGYIEVLLRN